MSKDLMKAANKKKKKLEPLSNAFESAASKLSSLISPKRATEENKNSLAPSERNIGDGEDTIGKMEMELEGLKLGEQNSLK